MLFVYSSSLASYRLSPDHPLQPERFTLAFDLLEAWDMLDVPEKAESGRPPALRADVEPAPAASDLDLALAHSHDYIDFVKRASEDPDRAVGHGIGMGDTPAFEGMHNAAVLAVGASALAVSAVASGERDRTCNLAGGLHHAAYDHASGFCVYNDVVVALKKALLSDEEVRIAYVDIDAHHGDGVEAGFCDEPRVLTISVHESGRYLFPGTGDASDVGRGGGAGSALNVPLPPFAGPESYGLAWSEVVEPALVAYRPDLIVLQAGADSHMNDPLTHLGQTVAGYVEMVTKVLDAAERLCAGRAVLLGGGGYRTFDEVPRMWAAATAIWMRREVPDSLPPDWLARSADAARGFGDEGCTVTETLAEEYPADERLDSPSVLEATRASIAAVRACSPLLKGSAAGSIRSLEEQLADLVDRELDAGV